MEYLNRMMKTLWRDKNFKGHPDCKNLRMINLCFVDDLLLFCKGHLKSTHLIKEKLEIFATMLGLKANPQKSCNYFGGLHNDVKRQINRSYNTMKEAYPPGIWGSH